MTFLSTHRHQQAFREFSRIDGWNAPLAVTLTMKQGIPIDQSRRAYERLTPERASQNLRHFLNLLNKRVYGKAYTRFNVRVPVIPILEGGTRSRLHYHLTIDCPRDDLLPMYPELIRSLWARTRWGYEQIDIQADADNGWINYSSKLRDKPSFEDSIDWVNYSSLD